MHYCSMRCYWWGSSHSKSH